MSVKHVTAIGRRVNPSCPLTVVACEGLTPLNPDTEKYICHWIPDVPENGERDQPEEEILEFLLDDLVEKPGDIRWGIPERHSQARGGLSIHIRASR